MKKVNWVNLLIDTAMALVFVLLFDHTILGGMEFHEIAGLAFFAAVLTHLLLNLRWIKTVTLKIFDRKLPGRTRLIYFLNLLLLLCLGFIVFSGIVISKYLFPNLTLGNEMWFKITHTSVSYLSLIIIGVHLGLNWSWMINQLKNLLGIRKSNKLLLAATRVVVLAILLFGSYQIYTNNFAAKLAGLSMLGNTGQTQIMPARDGGSVNGDGFAERQMPPRLEGADTDQTGEFLERGADPYADGKKMPGGHGPDGQRSGTAAAVLNYSSIMGAWTIITYYLDKLIRRKRLQPAG